MKYWLLFLVGCSSEVLLPPPPDDQCSDDMCSLGESCQNTDQSCSLKCAPEPATCTHDLATWCGCDGFLYRGSGMKECLEVAVKHSGLCDGTTLDKFNCQGPACCQVSSDCQEGFECNYGFCEE